MKALKLIAVFLLLVGGLVVALCWDSLFPPTDRNSEFASEDWKNISEECDKIRNSWDEQQGWNEDLYRKQREDINRWKAMNLFSREGYNTVNNCLRENATTKTRDGYLKALHSTSFSDTELQQQYRGMTTLKQAEPLDGDQRVLEVEKRHKLYTGIRSFVNSSHTIVPKFDTDNGTWTPFESSRNSLLAAADRYRSDALYKEMSHIPGFAAGLDRTALEKKLNTQRKNFYETLSRQIIDHFQSEEPTPENIARLNQVYVQFADENTSEISELVRFLRNYKEQ